MKKRKPFRGGALPAFVGYYTSPEQTAPEYDPPMTEDCPFCNKPLYLSGPVKAASFCDFGANLSLFYRYHTECRSGVSQQDVYDLEALILEGSEKQ